VRRVSWAAKSAAFLAKEGESRRLRPFVIVGDGAFQMTGTEISTAVRLGLNPIIFVLNNDGYGTMRRIHEGKFHTIT
jgi:indolepyruvate decarboxylase